MSNDNPFQDVIVTKVPADGSPVRSSFALQGCAIILDPRAEFPFIVMPRLPEHLPTQELVPVGSGVFMQRGSVQGS